MARGGEGRRDLDEEDWKAMSVGWPVHSRPKMSPPACTYIKPAVQKPPSKGSYHLNNNQVHIAR